MLKFIKDYFDSSKRTLKSVEPMVKKIDDLESDFEKKSIDELKEIIQNIRKEAKKLGDDIPAKYKTSLKVVGKDADYVQKEEALKNYLTKHLPEVYATVREILKRKMDKRHYHVQMLASTILAQGYKLTELKTGEGKTLVFQLPAALYGLSGRGAHVVTVNDYLARRDGEYAGHLLHHLGYTVGVITPQQSYKFVPNDEVKKHKGDETGEKAMEQNVKDPGDCDGLNLIGCSKKDAYSCDIVYGTNNEFGFDYLRDNMTTSLDDIVQSELYFCIVDEADSILIDEARTPLIISAPAEESNDLYVKFAKVVPKLKEDDDYTVDEKAHTVMLTDNGADKIEKLIGVKNVWQDYKLAHHLENALKAYRLYKLDDEYIIKNGEVLIVDDFTGRVLEGRRYSDGLHQAIEAKEGVPIKRESKTLGTVTFQNFFRLYKILAGGSGTIMTEQEEFYKIYNLDSVEVPTNKPVIREDFNDRVYKDRELKMKAAVDEIIELQQKGQPVLVGTSTIEDSEYVSKVLEKRGIEHEVLNAKFHEQESKIVANAGRKGSVTVATNMAGRGTDIKLGGKNAKKEDKQEVIDLGGLAIIATQRHESRRIDNQLRGRSGRQGEPGMSRFYVALDDEIMRIQGGDFVKRVMDMTNLPDDIPIEAGIVGRSIEKAQKRMEDMHFDARKTVVEYDDVVNQQREIFYTRRRRLLEEIDHLEKEIKEKNGENTDLKELTKPLADLIWEKMVNEIQHLVSKHYLESREDDVDRVKVIEDFLDLSPDALIGESIKEAGMSTDEAYTIKPTLEHITKDKKEDELVEMFTEIIRIAFDKKIIEFSTDLPVVAKMLVFRTMDELWTNHLDAMKDLRDGIGLRGYAQQDPLVEYKNEAFSIFDTLIANVDAEVARKFLKIQKVVGPINPAPQVEMKTNEDQISDVLTGDREIAQQNMNKLKKIVNDVSKERQSAMRTEPQKTIKNEVEIGRNDPCPCGSGKKWKKCGMINAPEHKE